MDKNQTKELIRSFKIVLIGVFFWVIRPQYFTMFLLHETSIFNTFSVEIIGTICILVGTIIIHRVYPFPHSIFAILLCVILVIINALDIVYGIVLLLHPHFATTYLWGFGAFLEFLPFLMVLVLILESKLLEFGLRYFDNEDLSKKWHHFTYILFFGFAVPFYAFKALKLFGFLSFEGFPFSKQMVQAILLFIPVLCVLVFYFIYYIIILVSSFKFLSSLQNKDDLIFNPIEK